MRRRHSLSAERAVSAVLGTVLLLGIIVILMSVLASALLGVNFLDQSPSADIVYEEDEDGTVLIALADVRGLSADDTEIRLQNAGDCATWDGSGTLEKGDTMLLEGSDCPESLEEGDVIQVIGSDVLIDSYELTGVGTAFDQCEAVREGDDITITEDNSPYECDIVGEDGDRVGIDVTIEDGGTLDGAVKLNNSGEFNLNGGQITGRLVSERIPSVSSNSTIDGEIFLPEEGTGDDLQLKSETEMDGEISTIGEKVTLKENVTMTGGITVEYSEDSGVNDGVVLEDATVNGDIEAVEYTVVLKGDSLVDGDVNADSINCKDDSDITGDGSDACNG